MNSLQDKVIALTGAGQGLGRATAIAFDKEGAQVCLLGRTSSTLHGTADQMKGEALPIVTDVTSPNSVRSAFADIRDKIGHLDILVNNAAIYPLLKVESATDEQILNSIHTNLTGPILCIRESIPLLRTRGGGHIVNVSTESVLNPFPYLTFYATTKGGIEHLSRGLKNELRPDNIRVTLLRLGSMLDPAKSADTVFDPALSKQFREEYIAGGYQRMVGAGMRLETVADQIVNILKLPADASIDIMELRSI